MEESIPGWFSVALPLTEYSICIKEALMYPSLKLRMTKLWRVSILHFFASSFP